MVRTFVARPDAHQQHFTRSGAGHALEETQRATAIHPIVRAAPAASPPHTPVPARPPISTDTDASGLGRTSTAGRPSKPGGSVSPSPVPHRITTEPGLAGADLEFLVTLSSFRMAPCPLPVKSA